MKITLSWLKEHLETSASLEQLVEGLNQLGLVVDGVENPGDTLKEFVTVEILDAHPHPQADRLQVCQVNTGSEVVQVVCGASNARKGLKGVFARPGMTIPGKNITLTKATIRGVESSGMLCSFEELGLETTSSGIIELPTDAPVGMSYAEYAGLNDPLLDVEVTPNRGDCLSAYGLARDLAAAGFGTLKSLADASVRQAGTSPLQVHIKDFKACPLFMGLYLKGVQNKPSPLWLKRRLESVGLKSISALVDVTNYVAHDLGRPLHVFDADKLKGDLEIRLSVSGETLKALDEKEYTLEEGMIAIADAQGLVSLAGIMGGLETGCTLETRNVFLESAYFEPTLIAIAGQKLGILSEARHRFERGVDPQRVAYGLHRAAQLILEICGGEASESVQAGNVPSQCPEILFKYDTISALSGVKMDPREAVDSLEKLGFKAKSQDSAQAKVTVPSWRHDIQGPADLIEELLRLKGYEVIPEVPLHRVSSDISFESFPGSQSLQQRGWIVRRALAAQGFVEVLTWSFLKEEHAKLFQGGQENLKILNPISQDLSVMRPSLLPNLMTAVGRNRDRGLGDTALFEVGSVYQDQTWQGQDHRVAGVRLGACGPRHWRTSSQEVSSFEAKTDALRILEACGIEGRQVQVVPEAPSWYHPGRSGTLRLGPKNILATFGELHPALVDQMGLKARVVGFEISLSKLPPLKRQAQKKPLALSSYQPVERDLAFVLDRQVTAAELLQVVRQANRELIQAATIFDVYEGKGIPEGKKSYGVCFRLEPTQKTLTDEEIHKIMTQIIEAVKTTLKGDLRS